MAKVTYSRAQQIKEPPRIVAAAPTTVVNVKTAEGQRWRYIGRALPAKKLPASRWANTFKIEKDTPENRRAALAAYLCQLQTTGLFYHVADLRSEVLGCWCAPKPCHGHVLATLADCLKHHGGKCPNCGTAVKSSPMQRREPGHLAEYWRCPQCKCWGFQDIGLVKLLPDL